MSTSATQEQPSAAATGEGLTSGADAPLTRTGAMGFGLVPSNFDEAWRMASLLAKSKLVPKNYLGEPEDVLVAMLHGVEIGLPPMASLQSMAVINGKPGVYGDGFLAVIMSKPAYAKHVEYYELANGDQVKSLKQADYGNDETKAVSMFWRRGNPDPFIGEFSIGDAKRAKLWGKEGPWSTYPARQLKWRARGFAGRDGFAAELRGVKIAEELIDTPTDDDARGGSTPPSEPVRRSEKVAGSGQSPAAAAAGDSPEAVGTSDAPSTASPTTSAAASAPAGAAATPGAATDTPNPGSRNGTRQAPTKNAPKEPSGPAVTTTSLVITETAYVAPKDADPFWEVKAMVQEPGKAPVGFLFVTRDQALYKLAASCEGTDAKFAITWHGGKRPDGSACKVLTAIAAAN